jgi:hypothetical protein
MAPALLPIAIALGAAAVGTGIYEAVSKPSAPAAPTPAQTSAIQAQAAQAAAMAQANALSQRRGMASTILQNPLGATTQPNVARATLGN